MGNLGQGNNDNAMCDQREQLIGYLYDECTSDERRVVEAHLQECSTCRDEVGVLGAVRQDLLAWDVPPYESVWRPFVAPRTTSPWREMPAWAMAAAATLVFLAGAAGGAATHFLWPQASVAAAPATATLTPASAVTAADLASFKASVLAEMRSEIDQRASLVAAHERSADAPSLAAFDALSARLASVEESREQQIQLNKGFLGQIARTSSLNSQVAANRQSDGFQLINYGIEGR